MTVPDTPYGRSGPPGVVHRLLMSLSGAGDDHPLIVGAEQQDCPDPHVTHTMHSGQLIQLLIVICFIPPWCRGDLWPVNQQHFLGENEDSSRSQHRSRRPRVAVIGAGAAGSSAVYFLDFLGRHNASLAADVTLFEKTDRIGGRSTTVDIPGSDRGAPLELGASIFVPANRNLWKAAHIFNLSLQSSHGGGSDEDRGGLALWDGEHFVYEESKGSWYYWNMAKLLWNYGRSPVRVRTLVKQAVDAFTTAYSPAVQRSGPFETLSGLAKALSLSGIYTESTASYLTARGVGEDFVDDFVGAALRVNYGQTPAQTDALFGLVSLAAEGASSVSGGNRKIFERFVMDTDAHVKFRTPVQRLLRLDDHKGWLIPNHGVYDAVIVAVPFHLSKVQVVDASGHLDVPIQDYVRLHVTLLVTSAPFPRGDFFSPDLAGKEAPRTVLSTFAKAERGLRRRPRINSVNYLRKVGEDKWAVKIFSERRVDDELLDDLLGNGTVSWIYRREWDAYPRASPMQDRDFAPLKLADRLYYANIEQLISTMETETVAGWNAVNLLLADMFGYHSRRSWAEWD